MTQAGEPKSEKSDVARFVMVLAGVFAAAFAIANWQAFGLGIALLIAEHRPGLLKDAEWDAPASAERFSRRFHAGTPEHELTAWLEKNRFAVNPRDRTAGRAVNGLPCNEKIKVDWSVDAGGRLARADAVVSQIACL